MKFVCNKCKTKYSIADEKVRRKVLKIRCKNCSNIIIVREFGRTTEEEPVVAAQRQGSGVRPLARAFDSTFRPRRRTSSSMTPLPVPGRVGEGLPGLDEEFEPEETRLSAVPDFVAESGVPDEEWYLAVDGNQYGPMGFSELCSRVKRGETGAEAFVWRDGFDEWLELNDVPELRPFLPRHPPPPPRGKSGLYNIPSAGPAMPALPVMPAMPGSPTIPPVVAPVRPPRVPVAPQVGLRGFPVAAFPNVPPLTVAPIAPTFPPLEDLAPLPPMASRSSQEVLPVGVPVAPAASRTPLWMMVAGIGGGLAAICGLFLVGYFLFFERAKTPPPRLALNTHTQASHSPAAAPDSGTESIAFPPLEIERSEKAERKVGSSKVVAYGRPAPKKKPAKGASSLDLFRDTGNPSAEAPKAPAIHRAASGPRRQIAVNELLTLQRMHRPTLKACYDRALKRDDTLTEIRAEVEVTIGDTGVVRSVRVGAGNNPDLVTCITRSVRRWVFPAIGSQSFSFPIIFRIGA